MMNRLIVVIGFVVMLNSCATALIAGGVGAVAMGANERRTSGIVLEDQSIEIKIQTQISSDPERHRANVSVLSYNLNVLLTGEVPSREFGLRIEDHARRTANVRNVFNELIISEPANIGNASSDSVLTGKVKTSLVTGLKQRGFNAGHVKVKTARDTVYLMGIVTQNEAREAIEIARSVGGVAEVVPLFEVR